MVLPHSLSNAAELEPDDLAQHVIGDRKVGDHDQAAEERLLEDLDASLGLRSQQVGTDSLRQDFWSGRSLGVFAELEDRVGADVRGEQDDRVLEVDLASLAVLQRPFVEDLEEELQDVGMGLFDLVEQDDAVRPATNGLGEDAPFAVADVARRRALEARDCVGLLGTPTC